MEIGQRLLSSPKNVRYGDKEEIMSHDNNIVSKSAQGIQKALANKGLAFEVLEPSVSTRTANKAANAIGCDVAQIMKSLLFCSAKPSNLF